MRIFLSLTLFLAIVGGLNAQSDTTINGTTFTADGKVGIGNSYPHSSLYVNGPATFRDGENIDVAITKPAGKNGIIFNSAYASSNYNYVNYSRFNMYNFPKANPSKRYFFLGFNGQSGLAIQLGGKVGLGTLDPSEKLHIIGGVKLENSVANTAWRLVPNNDDSFSLKQAGYAGTINVSASGSSNVDLLNINDGKIGIGTSDTQGFKLGVKGKVAAEEVKVALHTGWSDFVFYDDYKLPSLSEVESHINEKGHLQNIPSAEEVEKDGIFLGEMNAKLLQKIEELTLYAIDQEKRLERQEEELKAQQKKLNALALQQAQIGFLKKELEGLRRDE